MRNIIVKRYWLPCSLKNPVAYLPKEDPGYTVIVTAILLEQLPFCTCCSFFFRKHRAGADFS